MCGDSTNPDDVARLMDGQQADMVLTDPPYGVSYVGTNNPNGKEWKMIENDDLRGDKLYQFLKAAFQNINTNPRTENGCITIGRDIYDFYKTYFDGIVSFE